MGRVKTDFGQVWEPTGGCKDDYANISPHDDDGQIVKLQEAAWRSFRDAERRYAKLTRPWKNRRQIALTGSWRSCAYQAELYASDSSRYANPATTLHTRGLAIDVSMNQKNQRIIKRILLARGWTQARPDDEPWHFSFHFTA